MMFARLLKRGFDLIFALLASIVAIPLLAAAALIVKLCSPEAPVLFKQKRIGYRGKEFIIYKLRSMTSQRDENGNLLPDQERLKRWGKIIRASNIDELPQIVNILRLEMSWIGPRPLLAHEMQVLSPDEQNLRQSMLPGITGWEAVNEGKSSNRRQMAEFDLDYISNWSIGLDLKIFCKTLLIIFLKLRPKDSVRAPALTNQEVFDQKPGQSTKP